MGFSVICQFSRIGSFYKLSHNNGYELVTYELETPKIWGNENMTNLAVKIGDICVKALWFQASCQPKGWLFCEMSGKGLLCMCH